MEQITTALISGFVALLVGGGSALLSLTQIRREHRRWLTDLKVAWSLELHKSRMATYPEAHRGLAPLSHASPDAVTPKSRRGGPAAQQLALLRRRSMRRRHHTRCSARPS